jgi:hypothetical protein
LAIPPASIREAKVITTWLGGKETYESRQ